MSSFPHLRASHTVTAARASNRPARTRRAPKAVHVRVDVSQNGRCQAYSTQSTDAQYSIYSGAVADVAAYFETIFKGESFLTIENYSDSECTTPSQAIYAGFLADGECHRFKTGYVQVVQGKDGTMWALVSNAGCEANLYTSYSLYSFKTTQLNNGDCVSPGYFFGKPSDGYDSHHWNRFDRYNRVDVRLDTVDYHRRIQGEHDSHYFSGFNPGVIPIVTAMAGFISGSLLL